MNKEIWDKVKKICMDRFEISERHLKPGNVMKDSGIDSLDSFELLYALEDEYDIFLEDSEANKCNTYCDVVDLVERKTTEKNPSV